MMKRIRQIERTINSKMKQIESGEITKVESKIGVEFNRLRDLDEASYEKLLVDYLKVCKDIK